MATVGQQLTSPESGWKRYDNMHPAIKYVGNSWTHNNSYPNGYNNTFSYSDENDTSQQHKIFFNFIGTKIRIINILSLGYSDNIKIKIDGVEYTHYQYNGTTVYQCLVFELTGLENKIHTVEMYDSDLNNTTRVGLDAIDIDSTGRLLHPDEVLDPKDLDIGKRIRCHYQASSGQVGTFSGLGQETSDFIPPTSSATPNGDFYFICVDKDHLGRWKLIADRNVQHSISWDTLNSAGIASGSGLPLGELALDFNGANYYNAGNKSDYFITGDITFGAKFKLRNLTGLQTIMGLTADGETLNDNVVYLLRITSTGNIEVGHEYGAGSNQFYTTASSYIQPNIDYSVTVVRDTTLKKYHIYVNGSLVESLTYTNDAEIAPTGLKHYLSLGRDNAGTNGLNYMNGTISVAYVWNKICSNTEIINSESGKLYGNESGLVFYIKGKKEELAFTTRLLTGGISSSDTDNEWNKYIVNSTLNGAITAGDNAVWNWSGIASWTSTASSSNASYRVCRGNSSSSGYATVPTSASTATNCNFRPVLLIEILTYNKSFIYINGEYKTWDNTNKQWVTVSTSLPSKDTFKNQGIDDISTLNREQTTFQQAMNNNGTLGSGKVFVTTVDLNKYFDLIGLNVK
jgi:hypothetical protein